jgi:hypothetical protein
MAFRFPGRLKLSQAIPSFTRAVATFGSSVIVRVLLCYRDFYRRSPRDGR